MTEPAHSILGASTMERWSECPGSVAFCLHLPRKSSKYADEGTFAHDKAARYVQSDLPAQEFQELPDEMKEAIVLYGATIHEDFRSDPNAQIFVERRFDLSSVYPGCFGTTDAVVWTPRSRILRVYDFKYGAGVVVSPERNLQMMYYGLGALVTMGFDPLEIELVIVQPRAKHKKGPVRRWRMNPLEMLDFEHDLIEACKRTEAWDAPLVPGRHCFFCPGKETCPAQREKKIKDAQDEFTDIVAA